MTELSVFQELYHFEGTEQTLAINQVTQEICLLKKVKIYNRQVYQFLADHQNIHIPRVYGFREENGVLIVAEEFIQGRTLQNILESGRQNFSTGQSVFTEARKFLNKSAVYNDASDEHWKLSVFSDVCDAVSFLHAAEPPIIHRDIKPSNIMITLDGVVKLLDYNAAKLLNKGETRDTVLLGTQGNAAPEQYGFGPSDVRTDVYGLGCLLKEMFPDKNELLPVIRKATAMDPANRFQSVKELQDAVREALGMTLETTIRAGKSGNAIYDDSGVKRHTTSEGNKNGQKSEKYLRRLGQNMIRVPGFRSGKVWHAVIAVIVYLAVVWMCFSFRLVGEDHTGTVVLYRVVLGLMSFTVIDIVTNWTGLWENAPGIRSGKRVIAALSKIAYSLLAITAWIIVLAVIQTITG